MHKNYVFKSMQLHAKFDLAPRKPDRVSFQNAMRCYTKM